MKKESKIILVFSLFSLLALHSEYALARSQETWICLVNNTADPIRVNVSSIDNFDWNGDSRPDKNWHGARIPANGGEKCKRAEVNPNANKGTDQQFTFTFGSSGGGGTFRMGRFSTNKGRHLWSFSKIDGYLNMDGDSGTKVTENGRGGFTAGHECNRVPKYCQRFDITR